MQSPEPSAVSHVFSLQGEGEERGQKRKRNKKNTSLLFSGRRPQGMMGFTELSLFGALK